MSDIAQIVAGIVLLFLIRYGTRWYITRGTGEVPPPMARLFGRDGGDVDGDLRWHSGSLTWQKARDGRWQRIEALTVK